MGEPGAPTGADRAVAKPGSFARIREKLPFGKKKEISRPPEEKPHEKIAAEKEAEVDAKITAEKIEDQKETADALTEVREKIEEEIGPSLAVGSPLDKEGSDKLSLESNFEQTSTRIENRTDSLLNAVNLNNSKDVEALVYSDPEELLIKSKAFSQIPGDVGSEAARVLPLSEFISQSKALESTISEYLSTVPPDAFVDQNEYYNLTWNIHRLDTESQGLRSKKGFGRVKTLVKRRQLENEKKNLEAQRDREAKEGFRNWQLKEKLRGLETERGRRIYAEASETILTNISDVSKLIDEIRDNSELMEEVDKSFIANTVKPFIDARLKMGNISPDVAEKSLHDAAALLRGEVEDAETEFTLKKGVVDAMGGGFDFSFDGRARVLGAIGNKMLALRTKQIIIKTSYASSGEQISNRFKEILEEANVEDNFGLVQELSYQFPSVHSGEVPYWKALIATPGIGNIISSKSMQDLDRNYFTSLSNKASKLFYYPTPDNIVKGLLARDSGDYSDSSSMEMSLMALSQRGDWSNIVNETISAYPDLGDSRDVLMGNLFKVEKVGDRPSYLRFREQMQEGISALKMGIILRGNSELTGLAIRSSAADELLAVLNKQGRISDSDFELLNDVIKDIPKIRGFLGLEEVLMGDGLDFDARLARAKILIEHLRRAEESQDENAQGLVEFFRNEQVQEYILKLSNSQEDIDLVLNMPIEHPGILGEAGGFTGYILGKPELYLNDSGVNFIVSFVDKYKDADDFWNYATSLIALVENGELSRDRLLAVRDKVDMDLWIHYMQHPSFIKTDEGIDFVKKFHESFKDTREFALREGSLLTFVENGEISPERLLEIRGHIDNDLWPDIARYPSFLKTDQEIDYFKKLDAAWKDGKAPVAREKCLNLVSQNKIDRNIALVLPDKLGWLSDKKMADVAVYVFDNPLVFLKNNVDIDFLNSIVGITGGRAKGILEGYADCSRKGVISMEDRPLFLDFVRQFRVVSPNIVGGYKEARKGGYEAVYISRLNSLAEKLTGSSPVSEEERQSPFYKDLIKAVYPHNSGTWTSYNSNESCMDRTSDLADFKIEPRYEIDLLSQSSVQLKEGESMDPAVLTSLQEPVYAVQRKLQEAGGDPEVMKQNLAMEIDKFVIEAKGKGAFESLDVSALNTDQKLFLLLSESVYGQHGVGPKELKDMMVTYEFSNFEDVADFIQGTQDRVSRASNQDYALLCELSQFYSDRIKEVNKRLVGAGFEDPEISPYMKKHFDELAKNNQSQARQDKINKLQVDKLGMSPGFIAQVSKVLEGKNGRKYTSQEVEAIIARYEGISGGLVDKSSTSGKKRTQALYGTLRSQRERTFEALKTIAGTDIDPASVHLGEISLQEALNAEAQLRSGIYDENQFAAYTAQKFVDIFEEERGITEENLQKFESESGKQREILHSYIVKNHESANARMVGGVCVSGDNPDKYGTENMWDMPNYLQLVLQDPESLQCQGLVLLHHFTDEQGKRILSASLNPSSTYLYTVDEAALFKGTMKTLEGFAESNNFDIIATSQNHTIRTNRTGGGFESALDEQVKKVGKQYKFSEPKVFSHHPSYMLQDMDVVWESSSQSA